MDENFPIDIDTMMGDGMMPVDGMHDAMYYSSSFESTLSPEAGAAIVIGSLAIFVLIFAANWKIYTKAGQPGWAAIVPIYNVIILLKIVKRPVWWILLLFVPIVNWIVSIIVTHRLSRSFGHGVGYTLGLIFLSCIFYPIVGFGSSTYQQLAD